MQACRGLAEEEYDRLKFPLLIELQFEPGHTLTLWHASVTCSLVASMSAGRVDASV